MLGATNTGRVARFGFCVCRYYGSSADPVKDLLRGYQTVEEREVDWNSMDAFKHVNNSQYVRWFEVARIRYLTDIIRISGETSFLSPKGVGPILKDIYTLFKGQVTFPDRVSIGIKATHIEETSWKEEYKIVSHKSQRVVCQGTGTMVTLNYDTGKRALIPTNVVEILEKDIAEISWKDK